MPSFVGSLPTQFVLWDHQTNMFTLYTSEYDGYIGISRYKLTPKVFDYPDHLSIKDDELCERFGFTEITGVGHFFFCQTVYRLIERGVILGQVIVGLSTHPILPRPESVQITTLYGGDLFDTLYEIQMIFRRHPALPFLLSRAEPSAPPAPSAPPFELPLPVERVALALARDYVQQKEVCPITQEAIAPGEVAVTACHCVFQAPLLTQWSLAHTTCPACRTPLAFRIVTV